MRRAAKVVLAAGVVSGAACVAYWSMFSQFSAYDDEGYLELTLRHFLTGQPLYSAVNTQYGPAYYLIFGALFKITGVSVTTDNGRIIQSAIWLVTPLVIGLTSLRITRSWGLGVLAGIATFAVLGPLVLEPMHPGALLVLLIALVGLATTYVPSRTGGGVALGALVAAAVLVKINVGGLALIAVGYAASLNFSGWPSRRLCRVVLALALTVVGPVLMFGDLAREPIQAYAIVAFCAGGALVLVTRSAGEPSVGEPSVPSPHAWRLVAAGFVGCSFVMVAVVLVLGSSPADLVRGVLIAPTRQRAFFKIDPVLSDTAILLAVASLIAAAATAGGFVSGTGRIGAALRIVVGGVLLLLVTGQPPIDLGLATNTKLGIAPLLAWVAALPSEVDDPRLRFTRVALPTLAVLQTLQAFPVAGSQVAFGAVLYPVVGVLCMHDGLRRLRATGRPVPQLTRLTALAGVLVWAVLVLLVRPGQAAHLRYKSNVPLAFAGAELLRLPASEQSVYTELVGRIEAAGCSVLIGQPTLGSLTLWSGADSPIGLEPDGWVTSLDDRQQTIVVKRLDATAGRRCAVKNQALEAQWRQSQPARTSPVSNYVAPFREDFEIGGYQLLLPAVGR